MIYSITFWTNANMSQFWDYLKMLMEAIQPGIMLAFAISAVGLLIGIIAKHFRKTHDDEMKSKDEDYEIRRY